MSQSKAAVSEPSEIAGRYQVVKKLGAGAFGTVYKAKDKILGRMVAIKTIRLEGLAAAGASLEELVQRFKTEAQVSAQLKHPNIVTIYDIGETDGTSYLAMEFIDGVGLDRVIASAGRIPLERAASLGAQVADALDFAHRNSVVHRDIKPANIMVEAGDRVKVTDFGIAKVTNSGEHLTITGSLLGTPSYMSPEQAKGAELDGRSDLFAVGCVLYEMLAGKKAFRGDSITGLIFKIITEEPQPLREMEPTLSDEAVRIITKALTKSPEGRYQSGRELADDLLALTRAGSMPTLRQSETPTAGVPATMLLGGPPGRPESPTMQAAPTAVSPPPTQVAAPPPTRPSVPPPPRVSPPPPRPAAARPAVAAARTSSRSGLWIGLAAAALVVLGAVGVGGWLLFQRMSGRTDTADRETVVPAEEARTTEPTAHPLRTTPPPEDTSPVEEARTEQARREETDARPEDGPAPAGDRTPVSRTDPARTETRREARLPDEGTVGVDAPERVRPPVERAQRPAPPAQDFGFLDQEPPMDGAEAGERLADAYRSQQGSTTSRGFGTNRRFRARERSPRQLMPAEMPAVATLRHLITFQEAFHRKQGRYGTLGELLQTAGLRLDVPVQANGFQRRGYRFELTPGEDGFQVTAIPAGPGPRPFIGDDSGIIRAGLE